MLFTINHKHLFTINHEIHEYNTRHNNNLHPSLSKLTKFKNGPFIMSIKVFNHLPQFLKASVNNPKQFRSSLKRFLYYHSFYCMEEYYEYTENMLWNCCITFKLLHMSISDVIFPISCISEWIIHILLTLCCYPLYFVTISIFVWNSNLYVMINFKLCYYLLLINVSLYLSIVDIRKWTSLLCVHNYVYGESYHVLVCKLATDVYFFSSVDSYFKLALDIWPVPYPLGCLTLYGLTECKINK
jgi:hypothetical protein